jgi:hypothetical protein
LSVSPVSLAGGDPILISVSYNPASQVLTEVLTDQTNGATCTKTYTGVNLATALGGNLGFVGFTGGTGGATATQQISNFAFSTVQAFANNLNVTADSAINVTNARVATTGTLTIGSNTLSLVSDDATGNPYSLTTGSVTLGGSPTFNLIASAGGGAASLTLGALGDGSSAS